MNTIGSHLPLFVFSIVIYLLLIVNQDSASAKTAYTNEVNDLITKSCSGTKFPNTCVSILEADPRSKAATNLKNLSRIAIEILPEKINEIVSLFTKVEKNVTDPNSKHNIAICIKVLCESYYNIKSWGIPDFDSGKYGDVKIDVNSCAISAIECRDTGTQFFSKEVETLYNFSLDIRNFMDMLSSG
ncbi:hypothetical protein Dsin_021428 [Dipteronia sinensis]|uniref:Pectinesterase inhibitor domain-containing protein n=1 Tax=Dipteronia sinensis TaxID=43782 RepID=A0AAD9ZZH9_9ROSI|nr:hypothetical protein Dsin_021428 [Dipteronia sinensis]